MAVDWAVAKDKYKDTQPVSGSGELQEWQVEGIPLRVCPEREGADNSSVYDQIVKGPAGLNADTGLDIPKAQSMQGE